MQSTEFDLISDLNLKPGDDFDWTNKTTSLYCVVAGNISSYLEVTKKVLTHLSKLYVKVFYIDGTLEHTINKHFSSTITILTNFCSSLKNVIFLHDNVSILNGIAIIGCNGWFNAKWDGEEKLASILNFHDVVYLSKTIKQLQRYNDVRNIFVVSNSVPKGEDLAPTLDKLYVDLTFSLMYDTEYKVTNWAFGSLFKMVNTVVDGINYNNNGKFNLEPYWLKKIIL